MKTMKKPVAAALLLASFAVSAIATAATPTSEDQSSLSTKAGIFGATAADQQSQGVNLPSGVPVDSGYGYLFIAGSAFTPRTSAQTVGYPGSGCAFSDGALTTSVNLPTGTTVNGVRLYYYNTQASRTVVWFFTKYDGLGGSDDLLTQETDGTAGYGDDYFSLATPEVIDNNAQSYVLTARTESDTRLCGMRVFYDEP